MTILGGSYFQTYVMLRCGRLGRFARWAEGLGVADPRPQRVTSWWGPVVMSGNVEQLGLESIRGLCPVDIIEADETRRCIMALPDHLRDAIVQEYVVCGKQAQKARALGIEVRAYQRRISLAHTLLLDLFNAAAADLPLEVDYRAPGRPAQA